MNGRLGFSIGHSASREPFQHPRGRRHVAPGPLKGIVDPLDGTLFEASSSNSAIAGHSQGTMVTVSLTPQLKDGQPQRDATDGQGESSHAESEPGRHAQTAWLVVSSISLARSIECRIFAS
jgi:hypothetical protein